jgi:predicted TIM-barrel fold metal-dependent hydrolase
MVTSSTLTLPPLACDCHVHVVGPQSKYPMIAARQYTAPQASIEQLSAHLARVGLQRTVIIQPSFYGTDNRALIDSLNLLKGAGRGIAVLERSVTQEQLKVLDSVGVRGIRINVESSHGRNAEDLRSELSYWNDKISFFDWHVQLFASQALIQQCSLTIRALDVAVVLDHFSLLDVGADGDKPSKLGELANIQNLLASGNVWLKLSAPYRLPPVGLTTAERVASLAQKLLQANIDRVVWGSDWPHTQREKGKRATQESAYRNIASAQLLEQIHHWLPTEALRQKVLVDNPSKLYGFPFDEADEAI